jgi:hypothetical protein
LERKGKQEHELTEDICGLIWVKKGLSILMTIGIGICLKK